MFTATNARTQSITSATTEVESTLINLNIIQAVASGKTDVAIYGNTNTIVNGNLIVGTPMTLDANYYASWQTTTANNLASGQMQSVIDTLTKLGYTVSRKSTDGQHIYWQISW
jgi:hypothetical protein